jgi:hypothetical protein
VREDNPGAIELYTKLGFIERARRTSWQANTDPHSPTFQTDITITNRNPRDWPTQFNWLSRLYPDLLAWHRNWSFNSLRPGIWNWLYLLFVDINIRQWAAVRKGRMEAALAWVPSGRGESLFAATGEQSDPHALTALLLQARRDLSHSYPNVALEFPAGAFDDAIQGAGYKSVRTLIWMQATS